MKANKLWCESTTNPVPALRIAVSRGFSGLTENVSRSSHGHSTPSLKISRKSVQSFSRNETKIQTNKEIDRKQYLVPRSIRDGVIKTFQRMDVISTNSTSLCDSLLRLWRYINHLLISYLLNCRKAAYLLCHWDLTSLRCIWSSNVVVLQESSAKLTNQRVSYAFTSSPLSFHPVIFCLLPSSSTVILVFYLFSTVYA